MKRDLRHVLAVMAVLLPITIAATLLTSGAATHLRHLRKIGGQATSSIHLDARADREALRDRVMVPRIPD